MPPGHPRRQPDRNLAVGKALTDGWKRIRGRQPFVEAQKRATVLFHGQKAHAMRRAVVNALDFLETDLGIERAVAYAYLSAASDFALSQVVDITTGVHGLIYKDGLPTLT